MSRTPQQLSLDSNTRSSSVSEYKPFVPGPNPELPAFVAQHASPYDPANDPYDVPAFEKDIVVDKAHPPKAIYDMHTYWSKKHWAAIREYIRHYLPDKYYPRGTGLVLDCFSGSGMTGVAAMMEGRPCVLVDASPAAAFISHCYTHPVDAEVLRDAYERMMNEPYPADLRRKLKASTGEDIQNLQQELDWLYATRCERCNGPATTEYVVYSERFQCPSCNKVVALYDCLEFTKPKKGRYCPHCTATHHGEPSTDWLISTRKKKFGSVPVLVSYKCAGKCKPARDQRAPNRYDFAKVEHVQKAEIPHWHPDRDMVVGWETRHKRRLDLQGVLKVADFYSRRNLWALSAWRSGVKRIEKEPGSLHISLTVPSITCSRMLREEKRAVQTGTYYIPPVSRHINVLNAVDYGKRIIISGQDALSSGPRSSAMVSCESSKSVQLPAESLDYVFTDPAYVHKVQYGELNYLWESWLGFDGCWLEQEIVVNPFRNKTIEDWDRDLRQALAGVHRALKPGRWLSLCYHDTDPGTWRRIQEMLLDTGFEIHTVTILDPKQKSSNQNIGEKVVKSDLVLNCKKPCPGDYRKDGSSSEREFASSRVREIILETLAHSGGQTRDKLWDIVLKRLLTRGQMAEHRFDEILKEVGFQSESGRWFLKEGFENLSQNDIRNEDDAGAALERFVRLRAIGVPAEFAARISLEKQALAREEVDEAAVEKYIKDQYLDDPAAARKFRLSGRLKGIEFYDCLFFYLTRFLKGRGTGKSPRRNLAEFLEEFLVRFKDGDKWLYRAPDRAEAESLRKSRQTGLGRRIRQYVAFLRGEGEFPKEKTPDAKTLVAWLKHCSAFGLADEGVVLYERGGLMAQLYGLSEDDRYDADEYYTNCKRKASKEQMDSQDELDLDEADAEAEEE